MTEKNSYVHGQFCWVDLQASDTAAAKTFYGALLGWDPQDVPTDMGPVYTMYMSHGKPAAGMGPLPPEMKAAGAPPMWSSYVRVDDAEATVKKATDLGAEVLMPVMKVMDHGWLAFLKDPTGAAFGLWQPNQHCGAGWVNSTGGFCWNELYANDLDKARAFYEQLFGWEFSTGDGPMSDYWTIKNGGEANGGMMKISADMGEIPPNWAVYFTVDSCKESLATVEKNGGKVFLQPMAIPDVGTFAGVQDPQGAVFMVIELVNKD